MRPSVRTARPIHPLILFALVYIFISQVTIQHPRQTCGACHLRFLFDDTIMKHITPVLSLTKRLDQRLTAFFPPKSFTQATFTCYSGSCDKRLYPGIKESQARTMVSTALAASGLENGRYLTLFGGGLQVSKIPETPPSYRS